MDRLQASKRKNSKFIKRWRLVLYFWFFCLWTSTPNSNSNFLATRSVSSIGISHGMAPTHLGTNKLTGWQNSRGVLAVQDRRASSSTNPHTGPSAMPGIPHGGRSCQKLIENPNVKLFRGRPFATLQDSQISGVCGVSKILITYSASRICDSTSWNAGWPGVSHFAPLAQPARVQLQELLKVNHWVSKTFLITLEFSSQTKESLTSQVRARGSGAHLHELSRHPYDVYTWP